MQVAAHVPVMYDQMLSFMSPQDGEVYVDGTFGAGGYTRGLLEGSNCNVIAIDRDKQVLPTAEALSKEFSGRFTLLLGPFGDMEQLLAAHGVEKVDGVVLDIGVSSMQIDQAERGFSFKQDGPLDMRMGSDGPDAAYFVNHSSEEEIANVIYNYGGERMSRRIAKAIVEKRNEEPFTRTGQLASLVRSVVKQGKSKVDPATRTFQAIRIWVNDELGELERALSAAERVLAPGGRLVVVTFHSLEDAIVKRFMKERSPKKEHVSKYAKNGEKPLEKHETFRILTNKSVLPEKQEVKSNVRARSAKLRAAIRTEILGEEECVPQLC